MAARSQARRPRLASLARQRVFQKCHAKPTYMAEAMP